MHILYKKRGRWRASQRETLLCLESCDVSGDSQSCLLQLTIHFHLRVLGGIVLKDLGRSERFQLRVGVNRINSIRFTKKISGSYATFTWEGRNGADGSLRGGVRGKALGGFLLWHIERGPFFVILHLVWFTFVSSKNLWPILRYGVLVWYSLYITDLNGFGLIYSLSIWFNGKELFGVIVGFQRPELWGARKTEKHRNMNRVTMLH